MDVRVPFCKVVSEHVCLFQSTHPPCVFVCFGFHGAVMLDFVPCSEECQQAQTRAVELRAMLDRSMRVESSPQEFPQVSAIRNA